MARTNMDRFGRTCEKCGASFLHKFNNRPGRFCSQKCVVESRRRPLIDRFRHYLGPKTETGCIPWTGSKYPTGYGYFHLVVDGKKGSLLAHRANYELAHGPIPEGMHVLHRCDNPICVNPDHLFLGTNADNIADMIAKGRTACGRRQHLAKLTDDAVRSIRERHASGVMRTQLAKEFGVSKDTISNVVRGETWKHV